MNSPRHVARAGSGRAESPRKMPTAKRSTAKWARSKAMPASPEHEAEAESSWQDFSDPGAWFLAQRLAAWVPVDVPCKLASRTLMCLDITLSAEKESPVFGCTESTVSLTAVTP